MTGSRLSPFSRWGLRALIGVASVLVLALIVVEAINRAPGRWLATDVLDGREVGQFGTLEIEGLSGRLLSRVRLQRLELRDAHGVWLEADDIELTWRGLSLLRGKLEIEAVEAAQIEIHRRPVQTSAPGTGGAGLSVSIDRVGLPSVVLAEAVLGRRFELEANAAIADLSHEDGIIRVDVRGRNGTADRLTLDLRRAASGALAGELDAQAPADGLVARALGMPERNMALDGRLAGLLNTGTGELVLTIDGQAAMQAALQWDRSGWSLDGDTHPSAIAPDVVSLPERLHLSARGPGRSLWPDMFRLEGDAITLGLARRNASEFETILTAEPAALGWLDAGGYRAETIALNGVLDRHARTFDGDVSLAGLGIDEWSAGPVTGPLDLQHVEGVWRFETELLATDLSAPSALLQRQFGASPVLAIAGRWTAAQDELLVTDLSLRGDNLTFEGRGDLNLRGGRQHIDGDIRLRDVAELNPAIAGPAAARIQLRRDPTEALSFEAGLDLSDTSLPEWSKAMLAGLRLAARAEPGDQPTPTVEVEADGLALSARAVADAETGAWQLTGDAAVSAPETEAIAVTGAAVGAFNVEFGEDMISLRTEVSTQSLAFDTVALDQPRLRSELRVSGEEINANWRLDAQSSAGPFALAGQVRRDRDDRISGELSGRAGPARAEARASLAGDAFGIELDLVEAQAQPRWDFAAQLDGRTGGVSQSTLNAVLEGRDIFLPGGALDRATIHARGQLDQLILNGEARGLLGAPFTLDLIGTASVMGGSRDAEMSISGELGGETVSSVQPIAIAVLDNDWSASGAISVGAGYAQASASSEARGVGIEARVRDIPARFVAALADFAELSGRLEGEAELTLQGAALTGDARLAALQIAPVDIEGVEPVDLEVDVRAGNAINIAARLNSEGLAGRAELAAAQSVRLGAMGRLTSVAAWTGRLDIDGDIASMSALVLPSGETLTGRFDVGLSKPVAAGGQWSGNVMVSGARYNSVRSGFDLSAIDLNAAVSSGGVELVSASASDRYGGQVAGSGRLSWAAGAPGGALRADFTQLRLVDRSDAQVTASGHADISLDDREILVAGRAEMHEARISPPENGAAAIPQIDVEEINLPVDTAPARRSLLPIRLDYQIVAPRNLFISARTFESEWSADLAIAGRLNALQIAGNANLLAGQAFLLNRPFRLQSGRVRFDGAPMEAGIALSASHQRPGFEAIIDVGGTLAAPTVAMRSVPALPQDEIFARLLFDRSTASLSAFEAAQLAAQLSGRNLLTMVARLREAARIDRLNVASGENGDIVVTGGRQFGERLYVEIESGTAEALSSARVEWSLTPDISILSRLTGDTNASISVRWRTEYD